jgi:hypothetical protein
MSAREVGIEAMKLTPPATVSVIGWVGAHVPGLIQFLTLIYVIGLAVQTCYRGWRWWQRRKLAADAADQAGA